MGLKIRHDNRMTPKDCLEWSEAVHIGQSVFHEAGFCRQVSNWRRYALRPGIRQQSVKGLSQRFMVALCDVGMSACRTCSDRYSPSFRKDRSVFR
jgi:hypothetical protein